MCQSVEEVFLKVGVSLKMSHWAFLACVSLSGRGFPKGWCFPKNEPLGFLDVCQSVEEFFLKVGVSLDK